MSLNGANELVRKLRAIDVVLRQEKVPVKLRFLY